MHCLPMAFRETRPMKPLAASLYRLLPSRLDSSEAEQERKHRVFAQIAVEAEAKLLRLARRLCSGNEDKAQDCVQNALIRGYQAYLDGKFQEGSNALAWLMRILTNEFLTDYRRQKHIIAIDLDTLIAEGKILPEALHTARRDHPGTALLADTLDEDLERALARLKPALRLTVLLVDIDEMTYAEAACAMSIPIGTVRSRLFRAHEQLAEILQTFAEQRRAS